MEYHEAANVLFGLRRYPARTGVAPTRRLLDHLGSPEGSFRVVQVGGSNGKGSTARMVESILREAGYDVGLYTSPHLDDLRERIRVNGRLVRKAAVREYVAELEPYVHEQKRRSDGAPPTFFEAMTGLAARTFAREGVDIAVFEVGIGGRHDATSALDPAAAAVTNVTMEHADVLGETIAEIARDKAAIAPAGNPLVTAATGEALDIVKTVGQVRTVGTGDADVTVTNRGRDGIEQAVTIETDGDRIETALALLGGHQCYNAGVAVALCRQIADPSTVAIERGLRNADWPGRFEVMDREPLVVLDGAHNPGGCAGLTATLSEFEYRDLHIIFGAMAEKDHAGMAAALPAADTVYTAEPSIDRAEVPSALAAVFEADGRADQVGPHPSVASAVSAALSAAHPDDAVIVCGSLFAVAEARRRWHRGPIETRIDDTAAAEAVLRQADVSDSDIKRTAERAIHRTLTVRIPPNIAAKIDRTLAVLGGDCAVSAVDAGDHELVDAVLTGTDAQLRDLYSRLEDDGGACSRVAERIRRVIDGPAGGAGELPWADGTAVMAILNVTPDSFHDGGRYGTTEAALERADHLIDAGADIVDIGGESTRPGADPVPVETEIDRVVPVIEGLADTDVTVSVDTRKAAVAAAALEAGADIINDVSGLEDPEMRFVAAEHDVPLVVMHSIDAPVDPGADIEYDDVVRDTINALEERVLLAEKAGVDRSKIIIDPGLGFGKSKAEDFELLGRIGELRSLGCPVLIGHSRKSMFGLVGESDSEDRLAATVAATALAADRGADIVRVHDVAENVAAVRTVAAALDASRR